MDSLRIVGPFHSGSGYSRHARALLKCAREAGYRVRAVESDFSTEIAVTEDGSGKQTQLVRSVMPDESGIPAAQREMVRECLAEAELPAGTPTIILQLPRQIPYWVDHLAAAGLAGPTIGLTMVECDGIRPEVARRMRTVDMLAAPSQYVANVFRKYVSGIPVMVLPDPVDDDPFTTIGPRMSFAGRPDFLFGCVSTTHERKHWRELLHAFAEEFAVEEGATPQAGLVFKAGRSPHSDLDNLARGCRDYGAWVRVVRGDWDEETLASFYRSIDCYVSPSHEGFGLPFVEAGLCGKPSVALDRGGQTDIVNGRTGWMVRSEMQPCCGLYPAYFASDFNWAGCSVGELRRTMREAYETRLSVRNLKGLVARQHALNCFTPEAVAGRLREVVGTALEVWGARTTETRRQRESQRVSA